MAETPTVVRIARIDPAWDTPEIRAQVTAIPTQALAQPAESFVHRGRNTLVRLTIAGQPVVAKLFPAPRGWKRVTRRGVKSIQAFDHAARLMKANLGTPTPLAALQMDDGSGCYVCAWADGCRSVWDLHDGKLADGNRRANDLGAFVAAMHNAGILHRDNTPGNILLKPVSDHCEFFVVDTNRMRFGGVGMWSGLASLAQLECHGRLLDGYMTGRGWAGAQRSVAMLLFQFLVWRHRFAWWLKDGTRPWRRKLGF